MDNALAYSFKLEREALSLLRLIEDRADSEPYHLIQRLKAMAEKTELVMVDEAMRQESDISPVSFAIKFGFSPAQIEAMNSFCADFLPFGSLLAVQSFKGNKEILPIVYYGENEGGKIVGTFHIAETFIPEGGGGNPHIGSIQVHYSRAEGGYYAKKAAFNIGLEQDVLRLSSKAQKWQAIRLCNEAGLRLNQILLDLRFPAHDVVRVDLDSNSPRGAAPNVTIEVGANLAQGEYRLGTFAINIPEGGARAGILLNISQKKISMQLTANRSMESISLDNLEDDYSTG